MCQPGGVVSPLGDGNGRHGMEPCNGIAVLGGRSRQRSRTLRHQAGGGQQAERESGMSHFIGNVITREAEEQGGPVTRAASFPNQWTLVLGDLGQLPYGMAARNG